MKQVFTDYMKAKAITPDMHVLLWEIALAPLNIDDINEDYHPQLKTLTEIGFVGIDRNVAKVRTEAVLYFKSILALARDEGEL